MNYKELPIIELGKADHGDEPVISRKHPMMESVMTDIDDAARHLDHHALVSHIHKTVHPELYSDQAKDVNKVARDILHTGLNVDTFESAHRAIQTVSNEDDRDLLSKAYEKPVHYLPETSAPHMQVEYNRNHIRALKSIGFTPHNGNIVSQDHTGKLYTFNKESGELGLVGGKHSRHVKRTSIHPEEAKQESYAGDIASGYQRPKNDAHRATLYDYSKHSNQFNRLHAIGHSESWNNVDSSDFNHDVIKTLANRSKETTDAIRQGPKHEEEFHVFTAVSRHSNLDEKTAPKDEHGNMLFHAPAFSSTSLLPSVAEDFVRKKHGTDDGDVHDILKIRIPKGYKHGAYISPISEHPHEEEYLLNKGHTFRVHPEPKFHASYGQLYRQFDAELIDQDHDGSGNDVPVPPESFKGNNR